MDHNLPSGMDRRHFLKISMMAAIAASTEQYLWAASEKKNDIPFRKLGRTGESVSIVGIGGFHLGKPDEKEAIKIVRTALDNGVNFLDNCWDYNNGTSEVRMGLALRDGYRSKAFLMTKIDGRTRELAAKQIDESLHRLQTDHLDLLQLHEVIRMTDPDRAFAEGGAIEALTEARKAGKTRFIGFTGHKSPDIHLKMLETAAAHKFRFDTVQMPLNVMDAHFNSFQRRVLPVLEKEEIGVLGMKPMGSGIILESHTVSPVECLHYAMSLPTSVVITGCDSMPILEQALDAARTFKPMKEQDIAALMAKTKEAAQHGQFEKYKTADQFDSTAHTPAWLG